MMNRLVLILVLLLAPVTSFAEFPAYPTLQDVKEVFVDVNEAKLFCRIIGKGKPVIVLHGGPGLTQDYLLPQMAQLASQHQLIFYDQRANGRSTGDINSELMNVDTFVQDLETIRKTLGFEKISILGHSWGGFLAMKYAIAYPEAVESLILSNSMPASSEDLQIFLKEYMKRLAPYQAELKTIQKSQAFSVGDPEAVTRYWEIVFGVYFDKPEQISQLNLQMTPQTGMNVSKIYEKVGAVFRGPFNLHAQLARLKIPTLVIHGQTDVIPPVIAEHIHESISASDYVLLQGCGHFPYIEQPELYFKQINDFLEKNR